MFPRHITAHLLTALGDTPVVVLHGARQTGKSTLVQQIATATHPARYLTMDRAAVLAAARSDPEGFLLETKGPLILDEIQRAPELVLAIKASVDRDRRPGRFLLTGSANILQLTKLADLLVGRMEVLTLWPLSQGEIEKAREGFIDAVFGNELPDLPNSNTGGNIPSKKDLARRILSGGYPEAVGRSNLERRRQWFESYLSFILMRDIKDLSNVTGLADLPRLMTALAGRAGGLLNYAEIGRDVGLNNMAVKRYITLLRAAFIVQPIQPWFTNRVKRTVKSEKLYLGDSGLLAYLLDATPERFATDQKLAGTLLENFVALELHKQVSWSRTRPTIWHFRDHRGHEVDFVLENPGGIKLVGIEVKSKVALDEKDFQGLRMLAEVADARFHRGILLYGGSQTIPFGRNLKAMPISALWQLGARQVGDS